MGIFYLGLLLVLFSYFNFFVSSTMSTVDNISKLLDQSLTYNQEQLTAYLKDRFSQFDFNRDFAAVLDSLYNTDWLEKTLTGFLDIISSSSVELNQSFSLAISLYVSGLKNHLTIAITVLVLFLYLSALITKLVLRKQNTKRNLFLVILSMILNATVISGLLSFATYLLKLWNMSWIISLPLYLIILSFISLFLAWLVCDPKKIPFKEVVNFHNSLGQLIANSIMMMIVILLVLVFSVISQLLALLVAIPSLIYFSSILGVESESYVSEMIQTQRYQVFSRLLYPLKADKEA
ncbi:MAG: hypothetical protein WCR56_02755 [Bacilli bacterium]